MGFWGVLSWLYIAWVCDVMCRWVVNAFKFRSMKQIKLDTNDGFDDNEKPRKSNVDEEDSSTRANATTPSSGQERERVIKRKAKLSHPIRNGLGTFTPEHKSSTLDLKIDVKSMHKPQWLDDPYVKKGLSRVDKIVEDGNKKVTSYYDQTGKLVYQKECRRKTALVESEPPVNSFKHVNPPFYMKPQPIINNHSQALGYKTGLEEDIDKKFKEMFDNTSSEIAAAAKTTVDEDINKTFKEIYDMVVPTIF